MIAVSNLQTIHIIYEAFGKGDIPTMLDQLADDVQWEVWADNSAQKAGVPWFQAQSGKNGVMAFFQTIGDPTKFQLKDFQVLSILDGGNQIAAEIIIEADIPSIGGHFRDEEMHLWTFNDMGKVTRLRHYADTYKHIKAAGLH